MYTHKHPHTLPHIHTSIYTQASTHTPTHIHTSIHTHSHTHTQAHTHMHTHTSTRLHICACIHTRYHNPYECNGFMSLRHCMDPSLSPFLSVPILFLLQLSLPPSLALLSQLSSAITTFHLHHPIALHNPTLTDTQVRFSRKG